ncbi:MAG TPA: hypothetical protein ENN98_02975 [Desulfurivibrio alkaliphilus]|uniref:DUF8082 domain-containing protein n=1 Tax=Desulfurivibrio alkaliphilus TaxID=427923 RepID=A0A7C2XNE6_9BACT|nr:hypothetical protein [Desulfurivibrio alkaliphilus]
MEALLQEITMLPRVRGAFFSMAEPSLLFSEMPANYQPETMKQLGASLERIFRMNGPCRLSVNSVEMLFDDSLLLAKQAGPGSTLVIIAEPDTNFDLLNMTSAMLIGELRNSAEKIRQNPAKAQQVMGQKRKLDYEEAKEEEPLKSALPIFQESLARAIGPIAAMVIRETVEKWLATGECDKSRFPALAEALCREIEDPPMEQEFRANIAKVL